MKKIAITIVLFLMTLTMMGQTKLNEFTTGKVLYEYPELAPMMTLQNVQWEVYQDSLVMTYTGKAMIKRLTKHGAPTKVIFPYPVKTGINEYTYQQGDIRIKIVHGAKNVVTKEERDTFADTMKKEIYY